MKSMFLIILVFILSVRISQAQWIPQAQLTGFGSDVPRISVADSNVVWVSGGASSAPKIYRTVNGGLNWVNIPFVLLDNPGSTNVPIFLSAIAAKDSLTAFVADGGGSFNGGNAKFFKTTNAGQSWELIDTSGGTTGFFDDVQFSKSEPQFGTALCDPEHGLGGPFSLWKTTDGGLTWVRTLAPGRQGCYGFYYASFVIDIQFYGFIVVSPLSLFQYPFITSSGGNSWYFGNDSMRVTNSGDIAFSNNKLNGVMVSGYQMPNIKRTTDGGLHWLSTNTGVPGGVFSGTCWVSGSDIVFIWGTGSAAGDVIRSDNNGANWIVQNTSAVQSIMEIDYARYGNRLVGYAINATGKVLKSGQEIIPIGIHPSSNEVPAQFILFQNYPNPFNPNTKIRFSLPVPSEGGVQDVRLIVYNILGRQVETLVSEKLRAGTYEVEWPPPSGNASSYSSGVYYYQLTVSSEQLTIIKETKKMVLVK